jgi:hypothetical protein
MSLPPLNHDDLGHIAKMIDRLKRMQKREHHHHGQSSMPATQIADSMRELRELYEEIEIRVTS